MDNNFQFKPINTQINSTSQPEIGPKGEGFKKFFSRKNLPKTSAILIYIRKKFVCFFFI